MTRGSESVILRGRWLIPAAGAPVVMDGAVVVQGEIITELGPWPEIAGKYPGAKILGSSGHAILPGLINCHHHCSGVSSLQQAIPDRPLLPWLMTLMRMRELDPYLAAALTAVRHLKAGITTLVDIAPVVGSPDQAATQIERRLSAYDDIGLRAEIGLQGPRERHRLVLADDADFLAALPAELKQAVRRGLLPPNELDWENVLALFEDFHTRFAHQPRLNLWPAPEGLPWVSDASFKRIRDAARRLETHLQTHTLECPQEIGYAQQHFGKSNIAHLHDLSLLGPKTSLAHMVWPDAAQIDLLTATGTHVVHNPSSNLRLSNGIAPLAAMLANGVNVALGMDGLAFADDDDMWNEMRLSLRLAGRPQSESAPVSAADVLAMATANGARLLGRSDLGTISVGAQADVICVKLDRITWPWIAPDVEPLELLIGRGPGRGSRPGGGKAGCGGWQPRPYRHGRPGT